MFGKHCDRGAGDVLFASRFLTVKKSTGKAPELCSSVAIAQPVAVSTAEISCFPYMQLRLVLVVHTVPFHFPDAEQAH